MKNKPKIYIDISKYSGNSLSEQRIYLLNGRDVKECVNGNFQVSTRRALESFITEANIASVIVTDKECYAKKSGKIYVIRGKDNNKMMKGKVYNLKNPNMLLDFWKTIG